MNILSIDGRLVKDTEIKMSQNDKKVVSFSIANRRDKDHVDYINCIAWEQNAEHINKYFKKGDGIQLVGELRQNIYTDKDGHNRSELFVLVRQVSFPIQKKKEEPNDNFTEKKEDKTNSTNSGVSSISGGQDIEINPEELPFY